MGAPPTLTPGEPKAPLLLPVVCVPPIVGEVPLEAVPVPPNPPVPLVVPPDPLDRLKPLPELAVPPIAEPEELPKGELEDPEVNEEPLLPKVDPEELLLPNVDPDELLLPKVDPDEPREDVELPKGEEAPPVDPFAVAPVGVIPFCCTDWPKKPVAATVCSPTWISRQSSFPVIGSRYRLRRNRWLLVFISWSMLLG